MLPGLAVRITLPFSDASGIVREWALKADKLLCYEHVGEDTKKPHIHLLLIRVSCTTERLKQLVKNIIPVGAKGNEFWSFKTKSKGLPCNDENSRRYIIYMSKGRHTPQYNKGYDPDFLETLKNSWLEKEEEENKDAKAYDAFEDSIYEWYQSNPQYFQEMRTDLVCVQHIPALKTHCRSWAFKAMGNLWTVRTATLAKMVFLTYLMRKHLPIPDDVKVW